MPKIKRPVRESDQSIVRPIVISVVQELLFDRMELPKDIKINYPGYTDTVAQPHGFISNKTEGPRMPSSDKVFIEVTEAYVADLIHTTVTSQIEQIPIFLNTDLEVEMRPIYASVEMKISLHYRAKNKTEARRWYDYMMMKIPDRSEVNLHMLKYSYSVPEAYMVILREIHRMTEAVDGYGDDFDTFFSKWVSPRYGLLTDQAGKSDLGVFKETQQRCLGYFDFSNEPDFGQRKDETDVWEVEIPYVLRYEKPKDVFFSYPIVIHNQVFSKKFRNERGLEMLEDHQTSRTWTLEHLKQFEPDAQLGQLKNFPGRYFPLFDEFMPRSIPPKTMRVFTTLVLLGDETTGGNALMNITDLEDPQFGMRFGNCVKQFLMNDCANITVTGESVFHLCLYRGRIPLDNSMIVMDENLNISSTQLLNKRFYYHLRLSIVTDLTKLSEGAKDRLRANPCVMDAVLDYILPEGRVLPPVKQVSSTGSASVGKPYAVVNGVITKQSFDNIAEMLVPRILTPGQTGWMAMNNSMRTVQHTNINSVYSIQK